MSQPFYQPARQNFSSSQSMQQPQGGFGGFGGGYQMPQQSFGGGFGGGYGSGFGFGFGGGFQPSFGGGFGGGYGSGFSPMFGGIGGLGFNPMMGQGFGMPMQGFNPDQRQLQPQQPQQNPFVAQDAELTAQMQSAPEYQAFENARKSWEGSEGYKSYQQKRQDLVRQMQESQRQPMYGGLGSLGFNPMMGPQFGMPMQGFAPYQERASARDPYRQQFQPQQDVARRQDQMPRIADPTSPLSETDWAARNAARAASGREFRPETYDAYLKGFKTPEQMQEAIRQRQTLTM